MKVGDLVCIRHSSIGVPKGTTGLIIGISEQQGYDKHDVYWVTPFQATARPRKRRYPGHYLEVLNDGR